MVDVLLLLWHLTALAIAVAGLLWVFGVKRLRDRCLRVGLGLAFVCLFLPCAVEELRSVGVRGSRAVTLPTIAFPDIDGTTLAISLVGHIVLALALMGRRLRGPDARRRAGQELDRARSRERPRIAAAPQEDEP